MGPSLKRQGTNYHLWLRPYSDRSKRGLIGLKGLRNFSFDIYIQLTVTTFSPAAADEPGVENDKRSFREQFQRVRPQVLQTLRKSVLSISNLYIQALMQ